MFVAIPNDLVSCFGLTNDSHTQHVMNTYLQTASHAWVYDNYLQIRSDWYIVFSLSRWTSAFVFKSKLNIYGILGSCKYYYYSIKSKSFRVDQTDGSAKTKYTGVDYLLPTLFLTSNTLTWILRCSDGFDRKWTKSVWNTVILYIPLNRSTSHTK